MLTESVILEVFREALILAHALAGQLHILLGRFKIGLWVLLLRYSRRRLRFTSRRSPLCRKPLRS